ncbi:hypothetical protein AFB00_21330 [Pseudonocardia sp. HH130630-07]|nr:hypothetical protein AFB00_21330 [Pseudonocardia sp. HH130630-07]
MTSRGSVPLSPVARVLWLTCSNEVLDHLVLENDLGDDVRISAGQGIRTLCGGVVLPAALSTAPRTRCGRCAQHETDVHARCRTPCGDRRRRFRPWR